MEVLALVIATVSSTATTALAIIEVLRYLRER